MTGICVPSQRDSLIPDSDLFSLSSRKWQSFLKSCFLACFFSLLIQDVVLKRAERGKWGGRDKRRRSVLVSLQTLLASQLCTLRSVRWEEGVGGSGWLEKEA